MLDRRSVIAGIAGWTIVGASAVRAQAWPSQQIKIVVPYIPGRRDRHARAASSPRRCGAARPAGHRREQGGGNTIIGMERSPSPSPTATRCCSARTTLATNAALGLKQPYDPLKDFQPISTIADIPDLIAVNKDVPVKDYAAFVEWVNKQPQKVRFASSGIGNQPHLWGELFRTRNKLKMEIVAYKGAADACAT